MGDCGVRSSPLMIGRRTEQLLKRLPWRREAPLSRGKAVSSHMALIDRDDHHACQQELSQQPRGPLALVVISWVHVPYQCRGCSPEAQVEVLAEHGGERTQAGRLVVRWESLLKVGEDVRQA